MIPYEELVAALDRWRLRNGLPVVTDGVSVGMAASHAAPPSGGFVMPPLAAATAPRPQPARPASEAELYEDAEVVEEDEYDNQGDDFAMKFGEAPAPAAPAPVAQYEDDQSTYVAPQAVEGDGYDTAYGRAEYADAAGAVEEEEEDWSKMPNYPGASGDTIDAGDEVLDEHAVEDDDAS